jgi:hypothetical protein
MGYEIVELATLLLNYNAAQWDANANQQRIELCPMPDGYELVFITTDCNGYESEMPLAEGGFLDLIQVMKHEVSDKFKHNKMY